MIHFHFRLKIFVDLFGNITKTMNMKKITLILFLFFGFFVSAQDITITQNNDPNNVTTSAVACTVGPDQVNEDEDLFLGMYFDNYFARAFDLETDHDIESDFTISSVEIGQGTGRNTTITVSLYTANTTDLTSEDLTLDLIASEDVFIISQADETVLFVPIDAVVPAGEILVMEVFVPNSGTETDEEFFMGVNSDGQTQPCYIKASNCGVDDYMDSAGIGGGQHYLMNVIGQETLSINQAELEKIEVFPNPVSDVINLELPAGLILEQARITDMNGKQLEANFVDGKMNASDLAAGQYILTLQTSAGNYNHNILKK
ncbi:hypothetical protein GCM10010832_21680 [Psychroflexus planctonicus]|uniref:Secretion system C-terminal sorting domain-containing protein n=2 Tax=Psychroflexus planctonicus TaxID=1526575 RepID=A0ABQ1SI80_9FLAO|nr:hypothetical protein GCM10010832_21680 [Psychroflexus planctonicus]